MGLEFRMTMDQHARDVFRDGTFICSIQWYPERSPRIVWRINILSSITLCELKEIVKELSSYSRTPFITEKVAAGYMIQRGGQTYHKDAEWFSTDRTWVKSVFEAAAFPNRRDAETILNKLIGV